MAFGFEMLLYLGLFEFETRILVSYLTSLTWFNIILSSKYVYYSHVYNTLYLCFSISNLYCLEVSKTYFSS